MFKHFASIQIEFIKEAMDTWWYSKSWSEQVLYLRKYPKTKYRITTKPSIYERQNLDFKKKQNDVKNTIDKAFAGLSTSDKSIFLKKLVDLTRYMNEDVSYYRRKLRDEMSFNIQELDAEINKLDKQWRTNSGITADLNKKRVEKAQLLDYYKFFNRRVFPRKIEFDLSYLELLTDLGGIDEKLTKPDSSGNQYYQDMQDVMNSINEWGKLLSDDIFDNDRKSQYQKLLMG